MLIATLTALVIGAGQASAAEIRQPLGFYVMQGVHSTNVSDATISSPKLTGFHIRDEWQLVEKTSNSYDWNWLDGQLARAERLDKQVTLGVYTGNNSPTWLGVPLVDDVPIPWDPKVLAEHAQMVAQLGAKYANNPRIDAVHISGTTTNQSLEMFYPAGLTSVAGYSDQKVLDSWKSAIDAYGAAFPNNSLILNLAIIPNWPRGTITHQVIDYAQAKLGDRATFQINSLKGTWASSTYQPPDPRADAPAHMDLIYDLAEEGEWVGWEMVSPSKDTKRFMGTFQNAMYLGELADPQYYQIYSNDVPLIPDGIVFGPPGGGNQPPPPPPPPPPTSGGGLAGQYFNDTALASFASSRVDATINFKSDWGSAPAGTAVKPDDSFSARWLGDVMVPTAGNWSFSTTSNDGVRLWIGDQLVIDNWATHAVTENTATLSLASGWHPLRLEYFQRGGLSELTLSYAGPGQAKAIIPSSRLRAPMAASFAFATPEPSSAVLVTLGAAGVAFSCRRRE